MRKYSNEERERVFLDRVTRRKDGHWSLKAGKNNGGYTYFWNGEKMVTSMRFAYELLIGPIPDGLVPDHVCRVRWCCNPAHAEITTQGENVRRGDAPRLSRERALAMTHCAQGHELTPENTYPRPDGLRRCLTCKRDRARLYYRQKKGVI